MLYKKFYSKRMLYILCSIVICITFVSNSVYATGLPGEYYINQRWRDLFAGISPTTNPGFITEANYPSVRLAICPTLQNSFLLIEGGYIHPIMLYHSLAFTFLSLSAQEGIPEMQLQGGVITPTGDTLQDFHNNYVLSYGINPWGRLSAGANLNIYHQSNFGSPIFGVSADLGLTYRMLRHPVLGDHVFGLAFQNLISPDLKRPSEINKNAANLKISWIAKIWEKRIDAGLDLNVKDFLAKGEEFLNDSKNIEFDVNSRVGFWLLRMFNTYVHLGMNKDKIIEYWGLTGGLNVPTVNNGRDFQAAYQYMSIVDDIDITSTHTVYIRADIGKHREEVYARRMARLASIGPGDLYNRARTFLSEGKYWDAFFLFGKIYVEYPDFFKNDYVRLFMGSCQEELDMREFSLENYNETKNLFPRSVVVPLADLGIMRIHYRDANSSGVANQFALLNTPTVPDSIKYHAFYIMGQQHIKDGSYENAIQLFNRIPDTHPQYAFAQHSLGVAYCLSDNIPRAIEAFDNVAQTSATSKEINEIQNRSFVMLGYIYYEGLGGQERTLSKAVSALRAIPPTSYYYEDAQLGLAWSGLRAKQLADCIAAAKTIQTISDKPVNQCEAALLEGYCYLVDKKYPDAVNVLTPAYEKISSYTPPSEEEKNKTKAMYDDLRGEYYEVASKANDLALTSQSSFVLSQIDSLRPSQIDFQGKILNNIVSMDEFARKSFFSRNAENVRQDLEYALATAEKLAGQKGIQKIQEKAVEKSKAIDKEMQKLEEELKNLEKDPEEE